ncbi:unnamed protein product [Psylliodes chrysocephalus]|uniref:Uncharacterized protein n=1 Tax=Psylliodes chrysocephalus TaxID=3402493 RepID=A0A9P0CC25_9CUCU|nr:unnamed protein product [Psylliodes chrysocephala]
MFHEKLNINYDEMDLRDAFRLNSGGNTNKPKPVIIECLTSKLKSEILSQAKLLKGTGIFISLDYTKEDYETKKIIFKHQKLVRSQGRSAQIKGNTLIIEGVTYKVDDLLEASNPSSLGESHRSRQNSTSSIGSSSRNTNRVLRSQHPNLKYFRYINFSFYVLNYELPNI